MRQPGFGPGSRPWQGRIIPLNYCRKKKNINFCIYCEQSEHVQLYAGQCANLTKAVMGPPGFEPGTFAV